MMSRAASAISALLLDWAVAVARAPRIERSSRGGDCRGGSARPPPGNAVSGGTRGILTPARTPAEAAPWRLPLSADHGWDLTEEERLLQSTARDFAAREV